VSGGYEWTSKGKEYRRTIAECPRNTPIRDMQMDFQITYLYAYATQLCRQQAHFNQNHENSHIRNIGPGEASHIKYKRLKLGGGQAYDGSSD
jgi:hypothetical protein